MQLPIFLIEKELKIFAEYFKEAVRSKTPLLDRIMRFIVKKEGKATAPHVCPAFGKTVWRSE